MVLILYGGGCVPSLFKGHGGEQCGSIRVMGGVIAKDNPSEVQVPRYIGPKFTT